MPRRTTPRLSEAFAQYQRTRSAHTAATTLTNDQSVLRRFVEGVCDPQVHLLSQEATEAWFAGEALRQSPASYNKVLQRVRGLLGFCQRRGWLPIDPLAELRPRRVPRTDRLQLSTDELRQLVETAENPRDRGMLAMAVNTGLRASDLIRLKVGDLDLAQGMVRVEIQKTADLDWLPVTSDLDAEMRTWLVWYTKRLARRGVDIAFDMRLFPALGPRNSVRDGNGRPLPYGDPQPYKPMCHPARVVQRGLVRIGIDQTRMQGFHTVRRSVGRAVFELALESGHDGALRTAQALLGHKSSATTELYLGVSADRIKRDQLLKGKSLLGAPDESNVVQLRQVASED